MKILAINCAPDFTYLTSKGLQFEIDHQTISQTFPLNFLCNKDDGTGNKVDFYTPDMAPYLEQFKGYQFIIVGWNPADYGPEVSHTGGYTCPIALNNGSFWISVRQDNPVVNMYPIHEMMHGIVRLLWKYGFMLQDFMDNTIVDGKLKPFYLNDYNSTDPQSNFNQTWRQIAPFVSVLNAPVAILQRTNDDKVQTIGTMSVNGFKCDTLELPWRQNLKNISCIPTGLYLVKWVRTFAFPFGVYQIQRVPNRDGIDIHSGNISKLHSRGCILLGKGFVDINNDGVLDIITSKVSVDAFNKLLNKQTCQLIVC